MRMRAIMKQEKNEYNDLVLLKSLLEDKAFKDINAELPVVGGRDLAARAIDPFIKSTFRTRMAFRTLSDMDSRIIVDTAGAEHLAGNGDMLFSMGGKVEHLRGAYVSREDVEAAVRETDGRCGL